MVDLVPAGRPVYLTRDLISEGLDLAAIIGVCTEVKGYLSYHTAMMVSQGWNDECSREFQYD